MRVKRSPTLLATGFGAILAVVSFGGCSSFTQVKVDALAKPGAERAIAYRIETNNPDLDQDSLSYKEAARLVRTALSGKGLYEASKAEMADMVVSLDYGISPPKMTRENRYATTYTAGTNDIDPKLSNDTSYSVTVITYEKYLRLSARENKSSTEGQPAAQVWTVDVSTEGENRDLRKALPVLAAATIEFVGVDTQGEKIIKLKDKDQNGAIAFVKKGM
jgi:hypothetical protein